ncbi:TetR/AcrR family transcriptional regulator [uncultured Robinsoniella sp.]|uniref:TetR/AcrR family transcriptional regulator n=1 Tax=uncultured Robinsoniella sp. TaxID=904190 RepID=UPI00374E42F2
MSKLESNKKQKKDALLNTAFDLFITKGIQKTSIADIVEKAGVAKGTFYLYFTDKYDLRNKLISHKANQLLSSSYEEMKTKNFDTFEEQMIFMVDNIINHLVADKSLLFLIAKHLSWGIFKNAMTRMDNDYDKNVYELYEQILAESGRTFEEPEIMIYMIIELVSGSIYSPILYDQPAPIEVIKPYIYDDIRHLIGKHSK